MFGTNRRLVWRCCTSLAHYPIAGQSDQIDLKIVLRDENEELMNEFLTNGGKSIPKLIALDQNHEVVNSWDQDPPWQPKW